MTCKAKSVVKIFYLL